MFSCLKSLLDLWSYLVGSEPEVLISVLDIWGNTESVNTEVHSVDSRVFVPSVGWGGFDRNSHAVSQNLVFVILWLLIEQLSDWHRDNGGWDSSLLELFLGVNSNGHFGASGNQSDISLLWSFANDVASLGALVLGVRVTEIWEPLST